MDNLNASLSNSTSCRQRRSGRYGLKETFARAYSLPTGASSYTIHDLNIDSSSSLKKNYIIDTDSADYISYFNGLSLGERLGKDFRLPVQNNKPNSEIYRYNSLPNGNYDVTTSYAGSLIQDRPTSINESISSNSYISSITRPHKKKKTILRSLSNSDVSEVINPFPFSGEDAVVISDSFNESKSLVCDHSSSSSLYEVDNCSHMHLSTLIRNALFNILKILLNFTIFSLILLFIIFIISFYNQYNIKTCGNANNVTLPIKYIKNNLTLYLIGQESAIAVISDSIERYNYRKFSFGLLWIAGSIGVGKSRSISLIQNALGNQIKLHSVYGTLLPSTINLMDGIAMKLVNELDPCRPNVIIYDEFDDQTLNVKFLTILLKFLKNERTSSGVTYGISMKVFVIISGLYGQELITKSYTEHIISGGIRHNFNYERLQDELQNFMIIQDFPFHDVNFVPFLPLEEEHLIKCIHQEITFFANKKIDSFESLDLDEYFKSRNLSLQYIYDTVKIISNLSPLEYKKFIMISGCKRVHKTVNFLLTKQ